MAVSRTLFLAAAIALLLAPGAAAAKPVAHVLLDATPDALVVEHDAGDSLEVHVTARLQCTPGPGFEKPDDLGLVTANQTPPTVNRPGYLVAQIDHLAWALDGTTPGLYVIDAVVTVDVVEAAAPNTALTQNFSVGVAPDEAGVGSGRCGPEGYRVEATLVTVPLTFVPADDGPLSSSDRTPAAAGDVNWPAILIAGALLAAVAVFALLRERARRR